MVVVEAAAVVDVAATVLVVEVLPSTVGAVVVAAMVVVAPAGLDATSVVDVVVVVVLAVDDVTVTPAADAGSHTAASTRGDDVDPHATRASNIAVVDSARRPRRFATRSAPPAISSARPIRARGPMSEPVIGREADDAADAAADEHTSAIQGPMRAKLTPRFGRPEG